MNFVHVRKLIRNILSRNCCFKDLRLANLTKPRDSTSRMNYGSPFSLTSFAYVMLRLGQPKSCDPVFFISLYYYNMLRIQLN